MNNLLAIVEVVMGTDDEAQDLRTSWPNEFSYEILREVENISDAKRMIWNEYLSVINDKIIPEFDNECWQKNDICDGLLIEIVAKDTNRHARVLIGVKHIVDEEISKLGNIFNLSDIEAAQIMRRVYENTKDM